MSEHTAEGSAVKRLERSRDDRMLAGVCGGLARYFGIHPAFYRVGFVVLTLIGGAGVLIYLAAALVIPDEGKEDSVVSGALRDRGDRPWPLIGLGLLAVALVVLLSRATVWPHGDAAWILLLLAGGAILWLTHQRPSAQSAESPPVEGGADAATKALAAQDSRRVRRLGKGIAIAVGTLFALVLVSLAVFVAVFPVHLSHGVGQRTYAPAGIGDLHRSYSLGVGELRVDLSDVRLPVGETRVSARVDVGDLKIVVPRDAAVRVRADVRLGAVDLLGETDDGHNVDRSVDETGARVLILDAHTSVGSVRVARAVR